MTLRDIKIDFEERFRNKWTSLSVEYHFKSIISSILKIPFAEVNFHLEQSFGKDDLRLYREFLSRLSNDEPLQYILGETEFRDCRILCSPVALIPRPETEEIIDLAIEVLKEIEQPRILDLCTGTGCIAIALAHERRDSIVKGIDNFDEVITLAKTNQVLNDVEVEMLKRDVLSPVEMKEFEKGEFDLWISNPPYIPEKEKVRMDKNVLEFEPGEALFVPNNDPLLFYREIANSAKKGLKESGFLFFEIHEDFGQETIDLLEQIQFKNITVHKDLQGKNRMLSAQK